MNFLHVFRQVISVQQNDLPAQTTLMEYQVEDLRLQISKQRFVLIEGDLMGFVDVLTQNIKTDHFVTEAAGVQEVVTENNSLQFFKFSSLLLADLSSSY